MNAQTLIDTARHMIGSGKGLLAMDESTGTCNKRFAEAGIPQSEEMRRAYRDLIVTTPGIGDALGGAILFDETIRQKTLGGVPFAEALEKAGVIPGIKVDEGAKDLPFHPGEKVTEGLDGLRGRLKEYGSRGARFAKWRAVITPGEGIPTKACIKANAHALARYAALCQEADIVPIVEPEVLMDGNHTLERCREITEQTLHIVFKELYAAGVLLEGMVLKPNMVLPGLDCPVQDGVEAVAEATLNTFRRTVPAAVAGIAFLSGGQSAELASARLNSMNIIAHKPGSRVPWPVAFSYSRAIQQPALEAWKGKPENVQAAQKILKHRMDCNKAAMAGKYTAAMEQA